ncbi:hypothetical protein [Agrobacterium tumefaciens]|uniref:hypothetical protein n=1 Tax=Agrobacterium tumefaciens TaxID=358 RepID=UPI001575654F|nr:hypothetical protein [Agrobacterium tumefaciens]NTZ91499.1 hypothetical protein [Agrobacterium tumefaciens]
MAVMVENRPETPGDAGTRHINAFSLKTHAFIRHIHVKATLEYELKLQDDLALVDSTYGQTQGASP